MWNLLSPEKKKDFIVTGTMILVFIPFMPFIVKSILNLLIGGN